MGTKLLGSVIRSTGAPEPEELGAAFLISVVAGVLILVVLVGVSTFIGSVTSLPGIRECLAAAGGCALILAIRAPAAAVLERDLRFQWIAVAEVLDQVTFFTIAIPFSISGDAVTGLALGVLLKGVPGGAVLLWAARLPVGRPTRRAIRSGTGFGLAVASVAALVLLEGTVPLIVLGDDRPRDLGWINTAAAVIGYGAVVMLILQRTSFGMFSDVRRRRGLVGEELQRVAECAVLLLAVMLAPVALAERWAPEVFGEAWIGSGGVFVGVGAGYLLMGPIAAATGALYAMGHGRRVVLLYLTMTGAYGGLLAAGALPTTGVGVAAAYAISRLVGVLLASVLVRAISTGWTLLPGAIAGGAAAGGLALIGVWDGSGQPIAGLGGLALLTVVYGVMGWRQGAWLWSRLRQPGGSRQRYAEQIEAPSAS